MPLTATLLTRSALERNLKAMMNRIHASQSTAKAILTAGPRVTASIINVLRLIVLKSLIVTSIHFANLPNVFHNNVEITHIAQTSSRTLVLKDTSASSRNVSTSNAQTMAIASLMSFATKQ